MSALDLWRDRLAALTRPRVLEIGTKGWDGSPPRHHQEMILGINPQAVWDGLDTEAGDGVSIVGDAHQLSSIIQDLDAIFCASALEHFRRPWVAAREMALAMKPGGILFIQTHQSFPVHGYPNDYFRFTVDALRELFAEDVGWRMLQAEYLYPCSIVPHTNTFAHALNWNFEAEAWLNTECIAERI